MYRRATIADIPFILDLLTEFYSKAGKVYGIPFDRRTTFHTVHQMIEHGVCLVGPASCAAASIAPFPYNRTEMVASTLFWYFKSAREITILESLKRECKAEGATVFAVASLFPANAIARHYRKIGLNPVEIASISRT